MPPLRSGWTPLRIVALASVAFAPMALLGRLWGWVALAVLLGLGLGQAPLFGVLGFELALVLAVFAALMGADLGRVYARALQAQPPRADWPARVLLRSTATAAALAAAVTAIPAVICAVRGAWVPTCDWRFGLEAIIALPLATAVLAGAAGHLVGIAVGPRRVLASVLAQAPALLVAGLAIWRFFAAPAVFTYNAILGYFPGNLYDENVQLGAPLAWSRLEQLAWIVAAVALVGTRLDVPSFRIRLAQPRPHGRRLGLIVVAVLAATAAGALRLEGGRLGFAIDAADIATELGGRIETDHFVIYYAKTPEIEADIALVAADHELRYAQVVELTGMAPAGKLHSFYFADRDQKSRLMGARDVEMAKPWRREIYLDHRAFPHSALRHEIAHSIASSFGSPVFGVSWTHFGPIPVPSAGMIEGLAVALDWPGGYDQPNPHESVRAMQGLHALPSLDSLFGIGFFSVSSARGYTTAGSFLRFLLDTYGAAKLRAVYGNGGDFDAAYGVPRSVLEAKWLAMIATITLPKADVAASAERFRGGSLFARPCPHAIAARRDEATDALIAGDRPRAIALMTDVCRAAPEEPRYRMDLGDFLATGSAFERAQATSYWAALASDAEGVTSSLRAQAYQRLARAYGSAGDLPRTRAAVAAGVALPLGPAERRTLEAMQFVLAHEGPARAALLAYFFPPRDSRDDGLALATAASTAEPALGLGWYFLGLQRTNRADWAGAALALDAAIARGLPSLSFVKNAARQLAIAAYRTHDAARLATAVGVLASAPMSSGDHLLAQDWISRAAHDRSKAPAAGPRVSPGP